MHGTPAPCRPPTVAESQSELQAGLQALQLHESDPMLLEASGAFSYKIFLTNFHYSPIFLFISLTLPNTDKQ